MNPLHRVVGVVEKEMVYTSFSSDPLPIQRPRLQQLEFARGGQVQQVEPGVVTPGQRYRQ